MKILMGGLVLTPIARTILANQDAGYNMFTQAGSPATPSYLTLTINTGIRVFAITSGAFPSGSKIKIINNGAIYGSGGNGGNGGNASAGGVNSGSAGTAGGIALSLPSGLALLEMDNTNGYILGGGAGGTGGSSFWGGGGLGYTGGGGGGGGAGGGPGGNGGTIGTGSIAPANGSASYLPHWNVSYWDEGFPSQFMEVGSGGAGGHDFYGDGAYGSNGGAYGTSGKAINLNGNSITWLGGNTAAQVKGAVS